MNNNYKQCPYCGETIIATAKKCKYCKSWIVETQEEYIRCPFCRKPVPKNAEKCSNCGEWLVDESIEHSCGIGISNPVVVIITILWFFIGIFILLIGLSDSNTHADSTVSVGLFITFIGYIATYIYMLPSIIAASRRHPQFFPIFLINLFFGETMIGWIGALIWATTHRQGRHTHW